MSDSLTSVTQAQTITFNEIPAQLRDPGTRVEVRPNYGDIGLLDFPTKALVASQMISGLAGITSVPGQLYPITAAGQGGQLFGRGSIAALQIALFVRNNPTTPLFACAVPDAVGSTAATQTILCAAAFASGAFSFNVRIGGFPVAVNVPASAQQTAATAAAIIAAINLVPDLPVTATAVATTQNVLLTAKNAGACGNEIDVRITDRSDAIFPIVPISVGVAGTTRATMAGGVGNPDLTPLLTAIGGIWFTDIVVPWVDVLSRAGIAAEGVRRYGAMVNLDARFYVGVVGSYTTVVNFGDAGNSIQMVQVGVRGQYEPGWLWAAAWAGVHSFRLANDPSRQSKGIAVVGLTAPDDGDVWLPQERDLLLNNGISTWTKLIDGTVVISRTITGYLQSNAGVLDPAWLDVMTPAVMTRIRYDWKGYVELVYPNAKLFDDDSIGAQYDDTAATPRRMKGSWGKRCLDYEKAGWIEGSASTVLQGYFIRNPNDKNRLDQEVVVRTAGNLMIEATVLEFAA